MRWERMGSEPRAPAHNENAVSFVLLFESRSHLIIVAFTGSHIRMPRKSIAHRVRTVFFWMHLAMGVSAGVIILLMSVTGVMLGYERQMIAWIDGVPKAAPPNLTVNSSGDVAAAPSSVELAAARLPLDTLLARAAVDRVAVASMVIKAGATDPVSVRFRDRANPSLALDPYTGAVIPTPQGGGGQAFFSGLRRWHRWMGVSAADARATARNITGTANLIFLFIVLSGLYLWWPNHWSRARLRTHTVFQPRLHGKARDFNWHHTLGFWSAIPLAIVVATGVFISFQWPERWLDRALGSAEEKAAVVASTSGAEGGAASGASTAASDAAISLEPTEPPSLPHAASLANVFATAQQARPEWRQITLTLAAPQDSTHTVLVAEGNTYRPDLRTTFDVHTETAERVAMRDFSSLSTARKLRAWVRFGHTGEVFGIVGQTIATLVTAAGALLVWTGFSLAYRRLTSWRRRRRRLASAQQPS